MQTPSDPNTTACPACGKDEATIKRRRGGLYLECPSPCYFMGPTAATEPQAVSGAKRVAEKRKREALA